MYLIHIKHIQLSKIKNLLQVDNFIWFVDVFIKFSRLFVVSLVTIDLYKSNIFILASYSVLFNDCTIQLRALTHTRT